MVIGTGIYHRQLILKEERHIFIMGISTIAAFRQQQAKQEEAALLGLSGLASGYSRHSFIEARMERAAGHILQLLEDGKHEEAEALMATSTLGDPGLEGLEEEEHGKCHTTIPS